MNKNKITSAESTIKAISDLAYEFLSEAMDEESTLQFGSIAKLDGENTESNDFFPGFNPVSEIHYAFKALENMTATGPGFKDIHSAEFTEWARLPRCGWPLGPSSWQSLDMTDDVKKLLGFNETKFELNGGGLTLIVTLDEDKLSVGAIWKKAA